MLDFVDHGVTTAKFGSQARFDQKISVRIMLVPRPTAVPRYQDPPNLIW